MNTLAIQVMENSTAKQSNYNSHKKTKRSKNAKGGPGQSKEQKIMIGPNFQLNKTQFDTFLQQQQMINQQQL